VLVKDICFDVNKDVYSNRLIDEDEIEVLKASEDPKPTTIVVGAEGGGGLIEHTTR